MSIRGIDVSDYQPNVNWQAVANSGITFAFVKSTEGTTFVAETFARNWAAMKAAGIQRGAYHFFRPASSIQGQIDLFLKTVKLEPGDMPAVLDVESTGGLGATEICDRMAIWLEAVEKATKMRPIIYTYPGFWDNLGTKRFGDYPLWIAHYTTAQEPWVPGGWNTWTFWQYTDKGSVGGVAGSVDVNIFESLREGSPAPKVQEIQKHLKNKGFYQGTIDGNYSTSTKSAAIAFQKSQGLEADGIVGLKTLTALLSKFPSGTFPTPSPSPAPSPVPAPKPTPLPTPTPTPLPMGGIRLIDVCLSYKANTNQDIALIWLQSQIAPSLMAEFTQRWRNQSLPQVTFVRLLDVCKYYRGLPNQDQSLDWLQSQLSAKILTEFAQRWRGQVPVPETTASIRLIDVCKYYRGLANQDQSLDWLQSQLSPTVLADFDRRWRAATGSNP
ncbi:GH25 family lysozyme [Kamptonema animale CS-326]|jgi:lysozyme|uniref:GH25 family lysozyme n=1 Tax=Kamptonema animale TaxID=92934 RepID=UPI00232F8526|nr:GH25 family lysozyme [Kamptonema animale]MDB9512276.1 GH25 family lysozyme [Kamptonema animale CS-326]